MRWEPSSYRPCWTTLNKKNTEIPRTRTQLVSDKEWLRRNHKWCFSSLFLLKEHKNCWCFWCTDTFLPLPELPEVLVFFFSFSKIIINKRKQYLHTESNRTWEDGRDLRCGWVGVKYIYTGTGSGRGTGCFLSLSDGRHALSVHSVEGRSVSEIWRLRHLCELLDLIVEDEHESAAHSSQHVWPGALEKRPRSLVLDDLLPAIHCALVHDVSWKREAEQTSVMKMGQRPKPWNCD